MACTVDIIFGDNHVNDDEDYDYGDYDDDDDDDDDEITLRIAHLRIAHWGAILRWAILSPSVIRIAHPNYYVFFELFVLDMGPG